jgi:hypothetical protein
MASTNPSAALEVTPPLGHRCLNYRNMMTLKFSLNLFTFEHVLYQIIIYMLSVECL